MSIIYTFKMFNSMARMIKHAEKVSGVDNLSFNKKERKGGKQKRTNIHLYLSKSYWKTYT